jgi:NAD(P)-dependent dehydrogenase (short-subunit alcohol dehydrogenase family)
MERTALITGGSKRLGRAFTEYLAGAGWNVIIHFNSSFTEVTELVKELKKRYPLQKFSALQADLTVASETETLIPKAVSEFGKIDLLINNASVFLPAHIVETTADLFDIHFNIHVRTPFFLIKAFAKHCKKGNVINIIDTRISSNKSDYAAYSLSKQGLWNLTKMAAFELAPEIRVNAIAPGIILPPEGKDMNYLRELADNVPMKRPGDVDSVLKSMDFILENDYLTGQIIYADGGQNIGCIN